MPRAFRWVVPPWEAGLVPVRWMAPAGSLRGLHSASRLPGMPAAAAGVADLDRQIREHLPHANVPWPGGRLYDPEGSPYRADHVGQYIRGACPCFGFFAALGMTSRARQGACTVCARSREVCDLDCGAVAAGKGAVCRRNAHAIARRDGTGLRTGRRR